MNGMVYLLRRLLSAIPVLLGVVVVLTLIFQLLGDPARMLAGQRTDAETLNAIRASLRLDRPLWQRVLGYLNDLSPVGQVLEAHQPGAFCPGGCKEAGQWALKTPWLGRSYQTGRPVMELYLENLGGTVILALSSMLIATVLGLLLGIWAAEREGTWVDMVVSIVAQLGLSAPSFFMAVVFMGVFAIALGPFTGLPTSGYWIRPNILTDGYSYYPAALVLPVLTLSIRPLAVLVQLMRESYITTLKQDFVRTARAKGLSERRIRWAHVLPNALGPFLVSVSGWLANLLTGAFFVEYIFDWQGVGRLLIDALGQNDFPVVAGCCVLTSVLFVLTNVLTDVIHALIDPRIRLQG